MRIDFSRIVGNYLPADKKNDSYLASELRRLGSRKFGNAQEATQAVADTVYSAIGVRLNSGDIRHLTEDIGKKLK